MAELASSNLASRGSSSSSGTSRSLIDRIRSDDRDAWDRLVTLYAPLVAHQCRRWRLSEEDTADIFQEVFQAVAAHIAAFRRRTEHDTFRGWLRTITQHKIHDHYRGRQRQPQAEGGSEAHERMSQFAAPPLGSQTGSESIASANDPPTAEDQAVERQLFRRGLELIRAEFEPRTWQAFWLTAVEGRAAADVAVDLKMSPGAVRVAKSRVLGRLRAELGDDKP